MKAIAVIGIGCRFPGAVNKTAFWDLLVNRQDAVSVISKERLALSHHLKSMPTGVADKFHGGFLNDIEMFDARFFHISGREAAYIDPQQRILLETAWETFEDAGIIPRTLKGTRTGVFVGISTTDYSVRYHNHPKLVAPYVGTGNSPSIAANRISYQFDLNGPSMAVDTACSSSLLALHLACESLGRGESEMALAGGANIILSPLGKSVFGMANAMAADGRCKAFDARADGFVRSEGAGLVLLKPLDQAIADGDNIYSIIRGSAVNQDGRTNGLMAPNRWAQEKVLKDAVKDAGIKASDVEYVETHGTGTLLGDPIEANALARVYTEQRDPTRPLKIGSLKTNIGHMEAAAGIGNIIKVALAMKNGLIPASLHFEKPNPYIQFEELKLKVASEPQTWSSQERKLAGVSSFGFGGTNVHVVMEAFKTDSDRVTVPTLASNENYLISISAPQLSGLKELAQSYVDFLDSKAIQNSVTIEEFGRNLLCHRTVFDQRFAFVANSLPQARETLQEWISSHVTASKASEPITEAPVWVFSGQGSQWGGMGRQLMKTESVFRNHMQLCDQAMQKEVGWSLIAAIEDPEAKFETQIEKIQPILFAMAASLAELWKSWGIRPKATIGHSMGEVAAAYVAGILSLPDAVKIICQRSALMAKLKNQGGMAVIEASRMEAEAVLKNLGGKVSIAASNSPKSTIISGEKELVSQIVSDLEIKGTFAKLIKVDVASHSAQVDPILADVKIALSSIQPRKGTIPFYSTVLGKKTDGELLTPDYWVNNLRQPVSFAETVGLLIEEDSKLFMEISPHPLLTHPIEETGAGRVLALGSLRRTEDEKLTLLRTLAELITLGAKPDALGLYPKSTRRIDLPTYAWQGERFWSDDELEYYDFKSTQGLDSVEVKSADSRRRRIAQLRISGSDISYINDHKIQDITVFPGTGYIEMVRRACDNLLTNTPYQLKNISLKKALFLEADEEKNIQIIIQDINYLGAKFEVYSSSINLKKHIKNDTFWNLHAIGDIEFKKNISPPSQPDIPKLESFGKEITKTEFYDRLVKVGNTYGPSFQGVKSMWTKELLTLAELEIPPQLLEDLPKYLMHPAVLDICLQPLMAAVLFNKNTDSPYWPTSVESIRFFKSGAIPTWSWCRIEHQDDQKSRGSVTLYDDKYEVVAELNGIECEPVVGLNQTNVMAFPRRRSDWIYEMHWQLKDKDQSAARKLPRRLLILADEQGFAQAMATILSGEGHETTVISQKDFLAEWHLDVYGQSGENFGILHLWSLDLNGTAGEKETLALHQGLLKLFQHLQTNNLKSEFWFVTSGAQKVGDDPLNIFQAPMWGVVRSLIEEYPDQVNKIIDLSSTQPLLNQIDQVILQLKDASTENQIALRENHALVPRLKQKPVEDFERPPYFLRPDRAYLLTGGLGNLGLSCARWMIESGARHLVIFGRSPIRARQEWDNIQTDSEEFHRMISLKELERLGCEVTYVSMDISNLTSVKNWFDDWQKRQKPELAGIIHAAGIVYASAYEEMGSFDIENVFKAKISGTWNLHLVFEKPLDFFVVFSSFSVWLNSPYLAAYAGANAFMDALIHQRRQGGLSGLSLNWATWADRKSSAHESRGTYKGLGTIPHKAGLRVMEDFLSSGQVQAGVAVLNWQVIKSSHERLAANPILREVVSAQNQNPLEHTTEETQPMKSIKSDITNAPKESRQKVIEQYLIQLIAKVVRRMPHEIPVQQPLNTFGLDSLIALEIKNKINRDTGVNLPVTFFLQGPNLVEVAQHITLKFETLTHDAVNQLDLPPMTTQGTSINVDNLSEEDLDKMLETLTPDQIEAMSALKKTS